MLTHRGVLKFQGCKIPRGRGSSFHEYFSAENCRSESGAVEGRQRVTDDVTTPGEFRAEMDRRLYKGTYEDDLDGGPSIVMWQKFCVHPDCSGRPSEYQEIEMGADDMWDPTALGLLLELILSRDCPHPGTIPG